MPTHSSRHPLGLLVLCAGVAATLLLQSSSASAQTPTEVLVHLGKVTSLSLPSKSATLRVEDPSVASLSLLPSGQAQVTGLKVGSTRLVGRGEGGRPLVIAVRVVAR